MSDSTLTFFAEVAKRNGWELVKQPIDWDAKDTELKVGNIDCIWNGFYNEWQGKIIYMDNSVCR